jgi:hypothetical protein
MVACPVRAQVVPGAPPGGPAELWNEEFYCSFSHGGVAFVGGRGAGRQLAEVKTSDCGIPNESQCQIAWRSRVDWAEAARTAAKTKCKVHTFVVGRSPVFL